jgi:hypothetical protein
LNDRTPVRTLLIRGVYVAHMALEPVTTESFAREATTVGFGFFFGH